MQELFKIVDSNSDSISFLIFEFLIFIVLYKTKKFFF